MTSGAQVWPGSAQEPRWGSASPRGVQVTRSAEVSRGTLAPPPFVPYAYQVAPTRMAPGSGKFASCTGLVKVMLSPLEGPVEQAAGRHRIVLARTRSFMRADPI